MESPPQQPIQKKKRKTKVKKIIPTFSIRAGVFSITFP